MEPKEYDFEFPRGDTCPITFELIDSNKQIIQLSNSGEIYFTMKKNYNTTNYILQKRYSLGEITHTDNKYSLMLHSGDTAKLNYGSYVYDICVKSGDLTITVCKGQITLTNEATFISNE